MKSYKISESKYDDLISKIEFLNKRAAKIGLPAIEVNVIEKSKEMIKFWNVDHSQSWNMPVPFYTIEVIGNSPKIEGWEFIGKIEHTEAGNIIKSIGNITIPEVYRSVSSECDYCKKDRRRIETFILSSGNEFKQVGRNCLRDFTGYGDAEKMAEYAENFSNIFKEMEDKTGEDVFGGHKPDIFDTQTFLAFTIAAIQKSGWCSRSSGNGIPTADIVIDHITSKSSNEQPFTAAQFEEARDAIEVVKNAINAKKSVSDYEWNLKVILDSEIVTYHTSGYAASIIPFYLKEKSRQIEDQKKAKESKSQFLGKIGEKTGFTGLVLAMTLDLEGIYPSTLHKFIDTEGNIIIWYTSSVKLDTGKVYSGKATIKDHKTFKGENQTIITRAKLEELK